MKTDGVSDKPSLPMPEADALFARHDKESKRPYSSPVAQVQELRELIRQLERQRDHWREARRVAIEGGDILQRELAEVRLERDSHAFRLLEAQRAEENTILATENGLTPTGQYIANLEALAKAARNTLDRNKHLCEATLLELSQAVERVDGPEKTLDENRIKEIIQESGGDIGWAI